MTVTPKHQVDARDHVTGRETQDAFPGGPMGRTHAFDGRPLTAALGLRARTAQRNGCTAVLERATIHTLTGRLYYQGIPQ
jgi:hypothetical protein